jgi:hypothetical protein
MSQLIKKKLSNLFCEINGSIGGNNEIELCLTEKKVISKIKKIEILFNIDEKGELEKIESYFLLNVPRLEFNYYPKMRIDLKDLWFKNDSYNKNYEFSDTNSCRLYDISNIQPWGKTLNCVKKVKHDYEILHLDYLNIGLHSFKVLQKNENSEDVLFYFVSYVNRQYFLMQCQK